VRGTEFPNFIYNTPLCCPFRAAFQLGQMAHNSGIKRNGDGAHFDRLDNDTIATALDAVGYHTIYIGKYMNNFKGKARGWDDWRAVPENLVHQRYMEDGTYVTTALTNRALAAIKDAPADQPLFLMVGHVAPHAPWQPEAKYDDADVGPTRNNDDAKRKRTLLSVDDSTAAIAEALGSRWDTAVVIAASDNGYLLGEHHTEGKSHWWDEASRVMALVRAPGIAPGTDTRVTSTVDLPATILFAAGAEVNHPLDGRPLQESWTRDAVLIESWVKSSAGYRRKPFAALKGDGWVYVEAKQAKPHYYLLADGETQDQIGTLSAAERDDLAARLAELRNCRGANECG
jgi:N-acetylglucosamine-6-sulfatase